MKKKARPFYVFGKNLVNGDRKFKLKPCISVFRFLVLNVLIILAIMFSVLPLINSLT